MTHKPKNIHCLALYKKSLRTFNIEHADKVARRDSDWEVIEIIVSCFSTFQCSLSLRGSGFGEEVAASWLSSSPFFSRWQSLLYILSLRQKYCTPLACYTGCLQGLNPGLVHERVMLNQQSWPHLYIPGYKKTCGAYIMLGTQCTLHISHFPPLCLVVWDTHSLTREQSFVIMRPEFLGFDFQ